MKKYCQAMNKGRNMLTTGNQLRAARALVGMDQGALAKRAGVNINTISSMEKRGDEILTSGLDKVKAVMVVLEAEGVEFLNHGRPGVRMKPSSTKNDDDLVAVLDADEIWIIRHKGADRADSLRRALHKAFELAALGHCPTSIRNLGDRTIIEPDQIRRLFSRLGLIAHPAESK
jgi:transcriptional regulator with XRE-family HTH domain